MVDRKSGQHVVFHKALMHRERGKERRRGMLTCMVAYINALRRTPPGGRLVHVLLACPQPGVGAGH